MATPNCLYTYSGLRYAIALFQAHRRDHHGLMSENKKRKSLFITLSLLAQASTCFGSAYLTYWLASCHFKVKDCDVNANDTLIDDIRATCAFTILSASLTLARYYHKAKPQDRIAKQLIKTLDPNQPIHNQPKIVDALTQLKKIRSNCSLAVLSYTHKSIRMLLGFYTGFILTLQSRLINACIDNRNICETQVLINNNATQNIGLALMAALAASMTLKSDALSFHNQAAETRILECLAQHPTHNELPDDQATDLDALIAHSLEPDANYHNCCMA